MPPSRAVSPAEGQDRAEGDKGPHAGGTEGSFPTMLALFPSPLHPRAAAPELALLISRMQANADQVERDILETHKRLQQVRPQGPAAGHGGTGGSLKLQSAHWGWLKWGRQPLSFMVFPQTQWERGLSSPFLLDSQLGGLGRGTQVTPVSLHPPHRCPRPGPLPAWAPRLSVQPGELRVGPRRR